MGTKINFQPFFYFCCCSVAQSSLTLRPNEMQHIRLPCPSLSPRVCSNPCLLNKMVSSNHFILCHPLLLPSICPRIRVFSNESALCIRWPKYWSFRFSISPSNEYSRLISSRIDQLALLAFQGTLKSPIHHHSSRASILWWLAFII